MKFKTPTATIGIRRTDFELTVLDVNKKDAAAGTYNKVYHMATYFENNQGKRVEVMPNQAAFSPENIQQGAQQFGLLNQIPDVFFNGGYDSVLDSLQQETLNRLNTELGGKMPGVEMLGGKMPAAGVPGVVMPSGFGNTMPSPGDFNQ